MEIGIRSEMPTYSGGLGMLAGDTLRSAADVGLSMVGVTLLHRKGYFRQVLEADGRQVEAPDPWVVEQFLREQPQRVCVTIEGRSVGVRCWKYLLSGTEADVPVYFLDTDIPENAPSDRALTDVLYGGDETYRLSQELVLGIGGVRMLRALGYTDISRFHMNEGHSSLLVLELLAERGHIADPANILEEDVAAIRRQCVFTTHTPVAAGHDQFPMDLAARIVGRHQLTAIERMYSHAGMLNLTYLALNFSHYVNGVAMRHGEVSRSMFANYTIDAITNGVHAATWACDEFGHLFDRHIPGWRRDNFSLRYALSIARGEIRDAHAAAKRRLVDRVSRDTGVRLEPDALTLGFARRATAYKRADLLLQDVDRLKRIGTAAGRLQIVYAGKAHPRDESGKRLIQRVFAARSALGSAVTIVYLPNYDMQLGRLLTSGVDLWLNTPKPPQEASGTSGMKAALNAVPSLSTLDGWWIEGCVEGVTGWAIGSTPPVSNAGDDAADAAALYDKLEHTIVPLFREDRDAYSDVMRHSIALNGSFFNSHRMVEEYALKAYAA